MRNQFAGPCYRCGCMVEPGAGHFERRWSSAWSKWSVQHADCAIRWRGKPAPTVAEAFAAHKTRPAA